MKDTFFQALRFGIVGVLSNSVGYCLYLLLTWIGMDYKLAMTLLFIVGVAQTFIINKKWSFKYSHQDKSVLLRYSASYGFGYMLNLGALILLVDHAGMPHSVIQAIMILIVALLMFLLQKFWVFAPRPIN